jgi:hypothetical protein
LYISYLPPRTEKDRKKVKEKERERERETDRQTEREILIHITIYLGSPPGGCETRPTTRLFLNASGGQACLFSSWSRAGAMEESGIARERRRRRRRRGAKGTR